MCLSTWNSSNIKKLLAGFSWCRMFFCSRCCCNQYCWEAVLSAGRTRKAGSCHSWCRFSLEQSDLVELRPPLICKFGLGFLLLGLCLVSKYLLQFLNSEDLLTFLYRFDILCISKNFVCWLNRFPKTSFFTWSFKLIVSSPSLTLTNLQNFIFQARVVIEFSKKENWRTFDNYFSCKYREILYKKLFSFLKNINVHLLNFISFSTKTNIHTSSFRMQNYN